MSAAPVVVAMSGGVDSSTVAAMLCAEGTPIVGLTMQLWNQRRFADAPGMGEKRSGRCCSLDDVHDARRVAERLGIPYYVVNFEERFEREVVADFVAQYSAGRTPVPCSVCNSAIKFDELLNTARQIGAEIVATGHYACVGRDPDSGAFQLLRAVDEARDQTYFLWGLNQVQLSRARFPLGGMRKPEVRARAAELGLAIADKPDSHEICFVPGNDYRTFLAAYGAEQGSPPPATDGCTLVATDGKVLGTRAGVHHFTVGQRKGLGMASAKPLYVLRIDADSRRVVVGDDADLMSRTLTAGRCNWISGDIPAGPVRVSARIRHRHQPAPAWAQALPAGRLRVEFDQPQRAITPGQAVVLQQDDVILGGGWIDAAGS